MEHAWKLVANSWKLSWKVHVGSSWKFHENPAGPHAWKLDGQEWTLSRKVSVDSSWEFH